MEEAGGRMYQKPPEDYFLDEPDDGYWDDEGIDGYEPGELLGRVKGQPSLYRQEPYVSGY